MALQANASPFPLLMQGIVLLSCIHCAGIDCVILVHAFVAELH